MKTSACAAAAVIPNGALVAGVSAPDVAINVYPVAARSRLSPVKVAIPLTAATTRVPARVPPAGLLAMAITTVSVAVVTMVPAASRMAIWMAGVIGTPAVAVVGGTTKASALGSEPTSVVNMIGEPESPVAVAVTMIVPAALPAVTVAEARPWASVNTVVGVTEVPAGPASTPKVTGYPVVNGAPAPSRTSTTSGAVSPPIPTV